MGRVNTFKENLSLCVFMYRFQLVLTKLILQQRTVLCDTRPDILLPLKPIVSCFCRRPSIPITSRCVSRPGVFMGYVVVWSCSF